MKLTSKNVDQIFDNCLGKDDALVINGMVLKVSFDPEQIKKT